MDFGWLTQMHPGVVLVVLTMLIVGIIALAFFAYLTITARTNADLKRRMVEQGRSADETERILSAGDSQDSRKK